MSLMTIHKSMQKSLVDLFFYVNGKFDFSEGFPEVALRARGLKEINMEFIPTSHAI